MKVILIIAVLIFLIWVFNQRNKLERGEELRKVSGELRVKYPNFVRSLREAFQDKAQLVADDGKALCYKVPIETFNRHMGDLFFSIIDTTNVGNKPYIIQVFKGENGVEIHTERHFMVDNHDLSIDQYSIIFDNLSKEIMSDSRYLKSVTF